MRPAEAVSLDMKVIDGLHRSMEPAVAVNG